MDTDKETKEPYRPGFMQHFDRKDEHKGENRKRAGKKATPTGPQSIYSYFPAIPEGMDFREYVSRTSLVAC